MKVKELYSDPSKWTKAHFAMDKDGTPLYWNSTKAVSFCLVGAVRKCYGDTKEGDDILEKIKVKLIISGLCTPRFPLASWNDASERTFEEVKSLVEELDI